MSSIKARLMQPTGIEWMDIPFTLAGAVWKFVRNEYKNKASAHTKPGTQNSERGMGDIPKRYWETHAVPMHKLTRKIIRQCRKAYQTYPVTPEAVQKRKKHMKKALDLCYSLFDEIRLTLNELFGVWIRHKKTKINVYGKGDYKWLKRQSACARTRRIVLPACA